MENLLSFVDGPFVPIGIGVKSVPPPCKIRYLMQRDWLS
jgi:hypothetical protein